MANEYYDHTTYPSNGAPGSSAALRAELDAIEAAFNKLPTLTGNGSKILAVNSLGTALEAITTTGTGNGVRATSPTLTTPVFVGPVEQRSGTSAQEFRVYNTYTDAANYERGTALWSANILHFVTEVAGTGVPRGLVVGTNCNESLTLRTNSANRWVLNSSGHFLANNDNAYDIGATAANRPRTVYVGTGVQSPGLNSPSNTDLILQAPGTGSMLLAVGATSRWTLDNADNAFRPVANNTYDIGQNLARPRTVYAGTSVVTPTVAAANSVLVSGSGGIGYTTGAGGTVTQITNKGTAVTLNAICGEITMNNGALAANAVAQFTFNNSTMGASDNITIQHVSGGTLSAYHVQCACGGGAGTVSVRNVTAGSLSEAIVLRYTIHKTVTS